MLYLQKMLFLIFDLVLGGSRDNISTPFRFVKERGIFFRKRLEKKAEGGRENDPLLIIPVRMIYYPPRPILWRRVLCSCN